MACLIINNIKKGSINIGDGDADGDDDEFIIFWNLYYSIAVLFIVIWIIQEWILLVCTSIIGVDIIIRSMSII